MLTALTYLGASAFVLLLLSFLYVHEDREGGRKILVAWRYKLDDLIVGIYRLTLKLGKSFGKSFVRLILHYGAYRLVKKVLWWVHNLEHKLEAIVRQNKVVAREFRADRERNHLDEIADHKVESTLTETQREKLWRQ